MRGICIFNKGLTSRMDDFAVCGAFRLRAAFHEHDARYAFVPMPRNLTAGLDGDAPSQQDTPFKPQLPLHRFRRDDRKLLDLQTGMLGREMRISL
jgi:hypothetical protein